MDLKTILAGDYDGFENRILTYSPNSETGKSLENVVTHFLYLPFLKQWPTEDEFVTIIYNQIVPFCIPYKIRNARRLEFEKYPKKTHLITELQDQAKSLFQKSKKTRKTSGEVGELILFIIQEYLLGAPQIACKMHMKTSTEMPVHGSDGMHVFLKKNGSLCFLWGESKLYKDPKKAVKRLVESVVKFNQENEHGEIPKKRDIEILNQYPNIADPEIERNLLKYFNIYEPEYNQREEAYSCFIGFDFPDFEKIKELDEEKHREEFKNSYDKKIQEIYLAFIEELKETSIKKSEFYFFILPFSSVKEIRRKFYLKLGITDIDLEDEE